MITSAQLAYVFKFETEPLKRRLDWIKARHLKNQKDYDSALRENEYNKLLTDITKHAKQLSSLLNNAPESLKNALDHSCVKDVLSSSEGDENLPVVYGEGFTSDTVSRLQEIARVSKETSVNIYGDKKMFHRNRLLIDLRNCWEEFSGSPPSRSSAKNEFIDFIELACEYMDIDQKGLAKRHFNVK